MKAPSSGAIVSAVSDLSWEVLEAALQVSEQRLRDEDERCATLRPYRYLSLLTALLLIAALMAGFVRQDLDLVSGALCASALVVNLFWVIYPAGLMQWPMAKIRDKQHNVLMSQLFGHDARLHDLVLKQTQQQGCLYVFQSAILHDVLLQSRATNRINKDDVS